MIKYFFILSLITSFCACKTPQSFEYRDLKNFKIDSFGFDHSRISMDLVYFNPNNYGVNLKKIDCDVYVEHNYLGKFTLDTLMHIAKRSEFFIPSCMSVEMKNIFKNAFSTIFGTDVLVEVKGTTRVGKAGIFITVPFSYSGRHKFNLF